MEHKFFVDKIRRFFSSTQPIAAVGIGVHSIGFDKDYKNPKLNELLGMFSGVMEFVIQFFEYCFVKPSVRICQRKFSSRVWHQIVKGVDEVLNTAVISNDFAKSGSNSLRIEDGADSTTDNNKPIVGRDFANGAAETGSVSTSVYIPSDGYVKASYIFLGSNNDASSSGRFTEVVFTSSMIKFRDETGSQVDLASYSKDTWVDVTIKWVNDDVTVNIDGTDYSGLKAENAGSFPTAIALYTGDNGSKGTYTYFDNLDSDLF